MSSVLVGELETSGDEEVEGECADVEKRSESTMGVSEQLDEFDKMVNDIEVPRVRESDNTINLAEEIQKDGTLHTCREVATKNARGYFWERKLLFHKQEVGDLGYKSRLVLPKTRCAKVLKLAHDCLGHVGVKKTSALLAARFTWPGISNNIENCIKSCLSCAQVNKSGIVPANAVPRPIISTPFEECCIDLVGPLPKGKRGMQYPLTYICTASRWPEAVPLKSIADKDVCEGLMIIFSRTGLPSRLVSDQGRQFVSEVIV